MKKSKLFLALGLVFAMTAASMTGCGKKEEKKDDKKTEMTSDKKDDAANKDSMADKADDTNADNSMEADNNAQEQMEDGGESMEVSTHSDDAMSVFTKALAGQDSDGNSYFYVYNDDESFVALVMLSADGANSMNAVGPAVVNEDGSVTIQDTNSPLTYTATPSDNGGVDFIVHDPSGAGNDAKALLEAYGDVDTVINLIKAIDNGTEIMNPLAN